ncbi:ABC transporter permease [Neobacillus niacini]|uniref:ABC transporter permease n=1 Tax=Neobacillus niacini TaxID=86668 RepID=UPI002855ACD1|nr:ABC transporter permease [Neobacillus niacini]MDR6999496.1 putative ABC transport system permease protein [Neobacillus niacini]
MHKFKLFLKLVTRALFYRKIPTIVALLAIVLGTSVIGGLVNIYYDINDKMGKEFRVFGANILVSPSNQITKMNIDKVEKIHLNLPKNKLVGIAPMQYSVIELEKKSIVLVGTWLDQMKNVSPYWSVDGGWIRDRKNIKEAMIGINVAKKFDVKPGSIIKMSYSNKKVYPIRVKGIVSSGGKEDNQIFVNLGLAENITKKQTADIVFISLQNKGSDLEKEAQKLQASVSDIKVEPIKQMGKSEEKMLSKIQKLIRLIGIIIFIITILTLTTTMISMINERRKEVGLKKALGASNKLLLFEFLAEGMMISIIGSSFGIIASYYIAQLIGRSVFQADIAFQFIIIPWTYILAVIIVGISFFFPVRRIMEVDPAIVLKGN